MTSHPFTPFYECVSPLCRHDGSKESTFIFFLSLLQGQLNEFQLKFPFFFSLQKPNRLIDFQTVSWRTASKWFIYPGMQTQQVLQEVMKKKKKHTSPKCYYAVYYLMRGNNTRCFDPFALPSSELIHLIVQRASFLFVLPLNLSPIQYKVSFMMIGAKISHGCIQSSQTCFLWFVEFFGASHQKKKKISNFEQGLLQEF